MVALQATSRWFESNREYMKINVYTGTEGLKFWTNVEKQMKEIENEKLGIKRKDVCFATKEDLEKIRCKAYKYLL